jgi:hypothetical protein
MMVIDLSRQTWTKNERRVLSRCTVYLCTDHVDGVALSPKKDKLQSLVLEYIQDQGKQKRAS